MPHDDSAGTARYLAMQRETYARLATRSKYGNGPVVASEDEFVVGSYAEHERFDYERWLFDGVHIAAGCTALDYGCGPGRMLLRLSHIFQRVDGVDISPELLSVAERRTSHVASPPRLYLTDGQSLPDALVASHDVAFSVICLQHISVRRVRVAILASLFRALKPGGLLTFQMGYGPGHPSAVGYHEDFTEATGTNGDMDVRVLHPSEVGEDLRQLGFGNIAYAIVPTGPCDRHGAWIFVRAWTPGAGARVTPDRHWPGQGFVPSEDVPDAARLARRHHRQQDVIAVTAELAAEITALKEALAHEVASRHTAEEVLAATLEAFRTRDEGECLCLREQLARVRAADAPRLSTLIATTLARARTEGLRVAVFGAGDHTEWLTDTTSLPDGPISAVYDNDIRRHGQSVLGCIVEPIGHIVRNPPDLVIVSSLAFQEDMAVQVASFGLPHITIVRCYEAPGSTTTPHRPT